ncbi:MAG: GntR family transcriptional regulator, partial [Pseudonocardiaceae bacterium]
MQVVAYYQEAIRAGKLKPGDELPSIRRVADEWDVSVSTAQRALEALRD